MSGGQLLVFWCAVAGLVVIVLSELHRYRHASGRALGRASHARLLRELERQP